jgi:AraC-like DNA-binding protein
MLYLEHKPAAPLSRFVRVFWYARAPLVDHRRERILPTGCAQVILNLSRDFLLDCQEGGPQQRIAPALMVGQRSTYELVDTSDLADLIGIMFEPGVLPAFATDRADLFSNRNLALEDLWGRHARTLRDRLREVASPPERLRVLQAFFFARTEQSSFALHPAVEFALHQFGRTPSVATVAEVAQSTGWSERRFSQIFREQVGFAPKAWCRIQRFQRALQQLNAGRDMRWADLAIECGFYDQAHFANEFRAFSGIDASTYAITRTSQWANHVRVE